MASATGLERPPSTPDAPGSGGAASVDLFGVTFRSRVMLASGTCGFGRELAEVVDLDRLGGIVTKSVTLEPRAGNPAPRVAEWVGGMMNSVGLANPGVEGVRAEKIPWIRDNLRGLQVLVSVAGHREEEYPEIVGRLDDLDGFLGYELNLSCPNDRDLGGVPFALDEGALAEVVRATRQVTERPLMVKLAPNARDMADSARIAVESGADGLTLVNTMPGFLFQPAGGAPELGAGAGGTSGPALHPVAVEAVRRARAAVPVPIAGVGGVGSYRDAVDFFRAGADLVQVGTATFSDPRAAERIAVGLERYGLPRVPRPGQPTRGGS